MAAFEYKAINDTGKIVLGRIEANNDSDLEMRLGRMGLEMIRCWPARPSSWGSWGGRGGKVGRQELITFCFHLEQLTRAGVPILEGLGDLRDSVSNPRFREVIAALIEDIEGGKTLSEALARFPAIFSRVFHNLIRAGEHSGMLPDILRNLTESLKWQDELAAHTKKIVMYPAFVGTVVMGVMFFMMIYLVPQLTSFIASVGQELPFHTRALIGVSNFVINYWYLILSVILFPVGFLPTVTAWHKLLEGLGAKLPYLRNLRIYALSSLPRHIPGMVWYVSSRTLLYQEEGLGAGVVVAATAAELFLMATTGFIMSTMVFLQSMEPLRQYQSLRMVIPVAVLLVFAIIVLLPVLKRFPNWMVKRWNYDQFPAIQRGKLVACLIWLFFAWCGGGFLLYLLVRGFVPVPWSYIPFMIGAWALASAIGLTIGIGISGMGLREVTLAALLSFVIPPVTAIVAAIAYRLVFLAGELLWVVIIAWITKSVPGLTGTDE